MKGINIFISDKIRMHPIDFTEDGLGMAGHPIIILDTDVSDEVMLKAIRNALENSKSGLPTRPITKAEEKAYYKAMRIRSKKDLGIGADITLKNGSYRIIEINEKGLFRKSTVVDEVNLIEAVRDCLKLLSAKTN